MHLKPELVNLRNNRWNKYWVSTGGWIGNWSYFDGLQEGNNSSFSHNHDLYVGWWALCKGKHLIILTMKLPTQSSNRLKIILSLSKFKYNIWYFQRNRATWQNEIIRYKIFSLGIQEIVMKTVVLIKNNEMIGI